MIARLQPPRRVLLVAHHANPEWGSEPLIGWRWASHLDSLVSLTLLTHVRNRPAIERAGGLRGAIHYVDTERIARLVNRTNDWLWPKRAVVNRSFLEAISLREFDRQAVVYARSLIAAEEVDLIHRVSPISPRIPSGLGTLGVPFVLGPVNGGMSTAPGFEEVEKREWARAQALRPLARLLDPFQRTFRSSDAVLAATGTTLRWLPESCRDRARVLCENGVALERFDFRPERVGGPLRVLYLGRLLPYKGVQYLLTALARLDSNFDVCLDIVGAGPERSSLESQSHRLGLAGRVVFHGSVPVEEVPARMEGCDVFCLPSVRESGGSVVLEAMAAGKPVVVADHGGPSETVSEDVGFRLAAGSPEALVDGLARTLSRLSRDEPLRERLGRNARHHVAARYSWERKIEEALEVYDALLSPPSSVASDTRLG